MKIKKEDPSKVIVVPRPPRSLNHEMEPLNPVDTADEEVVAEQPEAHNRPTVEAIDPGCGPMKNQVEGPAAGLAGEGADTPAEESADAE